MNIEKETAKIMTNFYFQSQGLRVIYLMHRKKERGINVDKKQHKKISFNETDFEKIISEFLQIMKDNPKIPFRIYSSANERDFDKAIRNFKIRQIEAEFDGAKTKKSFYSDMKNRLISCLSRPDARTKDRKFLIDCDSEEEYESALEILAGITKNYTHYRTKKGRHILVQPFDVRLMPDHEIKKDGLLLLKF